MLRQLLFQCARVAIGGVFAAFRVWVHWWDPPRGAPQARALLATFLVVNALTLAGATDVLDLAQFVAGRSSASLWLWFIAMGTIITVLLDTPKASTFLDRCGRGITGAELWSHIIAITYVAATFVAVFLVVAPE